MYQLVSAIAKPLNSDGKWVAVEIGEVALDTLYTTYSRVIATLTNAFLPDLVALELNDLAATLAGQSITFNQFLALNANATLATSTTLPLIDPKYAKYADAFHAGYKISPVHPTAAPGSQYPSADLRWLYLTRPNTDYNLFVKSCLVSVNGFYHIIDSGPDGVWVNDGNRSAQLSRQNQIGITSFREVGQLTYVPITSQMVHKQSPQQFYKDRCYVDLGQDVSNKAVMLVLGGYLHVLDERSVRRVSGSCFAIDFGNISLLERYFESAPYLDLSTLGLEHTGRNASQISVAQLYSDAALLAYLTLPQSFFVILDQADIFVEHQAIRSAPLVDMFTSFVKPEWPLVVGAGKLGNYWATYEDGQYSINCRDAMWQRRIFTTVNPKVQVSASAQRDPQLPVAEPHAHFLKVGSQLSNTTMTRAAWLASQALLPV